MATLIAIDPGLTTGIVVGRTDGDRLLVDSAYVIKWDGRFECLWRLLSSRPDHIVMEDFRLFNHKKDSQVGSVFPSVQVIGTVDAFAWSLQLSDRIHIQQPADRIRVAVLPQHESTVRGITHTVAAYQHLRLFAIVHLKAPR